MSKVALKAKAQVVVCPFFQHRNVVVRLIGRLIDAWISAF